MLVRIMWSLFNTHIMIGLENYWDGEIETRKRTPWYTFHLGTSAISWYSKKQPIVMISTIEAEYIVVTTCATQTLWMRKILEIMHQKHNSPTKIFLV